MSLSITTICHYAECLYAECHCAKCHYAEFRGVSLFLLAWTNTVPYHTMKIITDVKRFMIKAHTVSYHKSCNVILSNPLAVKTQQPLELTKDNRKNLCEYQR